MSIDKDKYSDESNLKISEDVIATIVANTVKNVDGVMGMAPTPGKDVRRFFGKKGEGNGVSIAVVNNAVEVEVNIVVSFGVNVIETAHMVQAHVREGIETMTGLAVSKVNVIVAGMKLETENSKKTK